MSALEDRLEQEGISIPEVREPVGSYIPATRSGNLVFCSGQGPFEEGEPLYTGTVGGDITVEEGYEAARICALNCLAAVKSIVGSLEKVQQVVKVRGFVNGAPGFDKQPEVINGASELLQQVFGEKGKHARSALGTCNLPRNIPAEVEMIVEVED